MLSLHGYMSVDKQFFYNHPLSPTAAVVNVSSSVNASNTGIIGQLIYSLSGDTLLSINQTVPTVVHIRTAQGQAYSCHLTFMKAVVCFMFSITNSYCSFQSVSW